MFRTNYERTRRTSPMSSLDLILLLLLLPLCVYREWKWKWLNEAKFFFEYFSNRINVIWSSKDETDISIGLHKTVHLPLVSLDVFSIRSRFVSLLIEMNNVSPHSLFRLQILKCLRTLKDPSSSDENWLVKCRRNENSNRKKISNSVVFSPSTMFLLIDL